MKKFKVGIQLYSIREQMAQDMDATLKKVKEIGYDYVEFAGYFGKSAEEVKALLDKHGLEAVSVHQSIDLFLEQGQSAIDYLKVLGVKYVVVPWYNKSEFQENWDDTIAKFTKLGKMMKDNGLQFAYHNHDFEYDTLASGELIIDKLYDTLGSEIIDPEFDTCWVSYAGYNPCEYIERYSGRVGIIHLKDYVCAKNASGPVYDLIDKSGANKGIDTKASKEENGFKFRPVGYGVQRFNEILASAEKAGTEYVIVEQDQWYDDDPMECARMSREYLKNTFGI